jgi:hypothetical protein
MYQIAVNNIFENGMMPKLIQYTTHHIVEYILWAILQTVCHNTTEGDQQKLESREDITFSH